MRWMTAVFGIAALGSGLAACGKEPAKEAAPAATASAAPTVSAPAPAPTPSATVAVKKPSRPCPEGSSGTGTFEEPCKAKGKARIMDVSATNKVGDKGPTFKIINNSKQEILYGKIVAYFYDKAKKQIDSAGEKPRHRLTCAGNIFGGAVKPGEKIFMNFSCVKKEDVPKGVAFIEGEVQTVGFTDDTGNAADLYWRNDDLAPEERPKGGIK